ncbi:unnamed protein product [Echinostoma caproni]|uniref:Cilia- and flagella-associated protein 157 n=1 Tax=Echinostoma caproni TaxID=27848 RepID=A0A183A5Q9_9TREM|nr:unnamed protein product [Echinostoma caproni]
MTTTELPQTDNGEKTMDLEQTTLLSRVILENSELRENLEKLRAQHETDILEREKTFRDMQEELKQLETEKSTIARNFAEELQTFRDGNQLLEENLTYTQTLLQAEEVKMKLKTEEYASLLKANEHFQNVIGELDERNAKLLMDNTYLDQVAEITSYREFQEEADKHLMVGSCRTPSSIHRGSWDGLNGSVINNTPLETSEKRKTLNETPVVEYLPKALPPATLVNLAKNQPSQKASCLTVEIAYAVNCPEPVGIDHP